MGKHTTKMLPPFSGTVPHRNNGADIWAAIFLGQINASLDHVVLLYFHLLRSSQLFYPKYMTVGRP